MYWQWIDYAASRVPEPKVPLFLNVDESSISTCFTPKKGHVLKTMKTSTRPQTHSDARGAITQICCICNDAAIQSMLPQVFVGNEHCFTRKLLQSMSTYCDQPGNVLLRRRKSSWNSCTLMMEYVVLLASCLLPFAQRQPILLMDVAQCHIGRDVLAKAAELKLWLIFVPSRVTWLLQPCDTHCFYAMKAFLRRAWSQARSAHEGGVVPREAWLKLLFDVSAVFLASRPWAPAFVALGIIGNRRALSSALREVLPAEGCEAPTGQPRLASLKCIFPARHCISYPKLFRAIPGARKFWRLRIV